ncbi:putative ribosome quality control (RQC) complex YloA/Tae2 family protein [Breznakia sp. PF5-3]|uniref:Rqc2 family fibronectin-binding protein n=1 Tax=unclassified Breznakia TaxID=2623764 RepID=UPI002405C676|nr:MULTISPECIES: NFACT RNA binding domain-containing protein [unclassified Breznakia]MDF9823669.1 putative ribosome quality control (RQC) complex YloA/Tae2 family protein [Breznakia sp. PM6-1]MDF9834467.1 putative ribosome quality control (RQC) complex YloA/Tae2 family protein [Breznakia sp. PF5-3]MDF9838474.1 putative ribosome quality control (RQC) complex YloA/Tae2 family protein [Breznakia sp. PFB2-8]MDF9859139.1 putative ribosome quality control (RQC) complex YloA/Tae2 family protein [Brezn
MALDGLVLHQITKKLETLVPAKVNKIQQISNDEIIFTLRSNQRNHKLMISCHSVYNRIHITNREYQTMEIPNNFLMVLRKHIDRSIITQIKQLGLDRILQFTIEVKDDLSDYHNYYLYVELMGKYANLILVNHENKIVDALKRIPAFENNSRTIHPGATYTPPKPHDGKSNPFTASTFDENESLVKQFHGFSPLLSDEVLYRTKEGENFTDIMNEIKHSYQLFLHHKQDDILYHLIELKHLNLPYEAFEIMEGMDELYYKKEEKVRIKQQSGDIYKTVRYELKKNRKKLGKLIHTLEDANALDIYRLYGDLLYAYSEYHHQHKKEVILPSFETDEEYKIPLDEKISVKQNAKKYYQKYNKSKTAQIEVAKQIEKTKRIIQYFENIEVQLNQANLEDAIEIKEELANQGFMRKTNYKIRKKKKEVKPHFLTLCIDNTYIYVGKNNIQNEYITFKQAKRDDTWLHVKDMHGSHVVITDSTPSEKILRIAAQFAAYYSQGKESSSVPVNYCLIRQLKRPNKAAMGFVTLTNYKTIYIDPDRMEIQALVKQYAL